MRWTLYFWLFLGLNLSAQVPISPDLHQALQNETDNWLPLRLQLDQALDWERITQAWDQSGVPVADRPRRVNRLLMQQAQQSQQRLLRELQDLPATLVRDIRSYYLINMVLVKASPELVAQLRERSDLVYIDLANETFIPHEYFEGSQKAQSGQGVQGTENGLEAIHAPALWQMGYTGRGQKVFVYDSGVWSTHPAFANRFLGNYLPMHQAWSGAFSRHPSGINSNHGTHVLGTVAGLDPRNSDTIGVAFGSYWMANDLINASTAAGLPGIQHLVEAFQWALNPDGDTTTSSDVPAVINNSWRWRDEPDTVHCGGYIVQLMNAIEAAGIANVFSGGNTGPANTNLNSPQRIKSNPVNVFSVGSVNGNIAFPPPISAFSTRGPTQCPVSGNLEIHPEVVAPGENVRSAWGQDGFNTISGTSMSSPHVSGALLLLKEAFPHLSGAELMNALYQTATDLGTLGEDNTYGNGLINVEAAFNWLATQYTPRDPNAVQWDLAITDWSAAGLPEFGCDSTYLLDAIVTNKGLHGISQLQYRISVNGVLQSGWQTVNTPGLATAGGSDTLAALVAYAVGYGLQEVSLEVRLDSTEYDLVNNRKLWRYHKLPRWGGNSPFWGSGYDFFFDPSQYGVDTAGWYVDNPDGSFGWDTVSLPVSTPLGNLRAMSVALSDYAPALNQRDRLISPVLQFSANHALLSFHLAYRPVGPVPFLHDTFRVWMSTDCGASFSNLLYEAWGDSLNTTPSYGGNFIPGTNDFKAINISLPAITPPFPGGPAGQWVFAFETINRKGNDLFVSNISISGGAGVNEFLLNHTVRPNPSSGKVQIELPDEPSGRWALMDINGRTLEEGSVVQHRGALNLGAYPKGVYVLRLNTAHQSAIVRLIRD